MTRRMRPCCWSFCANTAIAYEDWIPIRRRCGYCSFRSRTGASWSMIAFQPSDGPAEDVFPAARGVVRGSEFGPGGSSAGEMADARGPAKGQAQEAGEVLSATQLPRPREDAAADRADSDGDSRYPRRGRDRLGPRPGPGQRTADRGVARGHRGVGKGDRRARPQAGRLGDLRLVTRRREGSGPALDGGHGIAPRAVWVGQSSAVLRGNRSGQRSQREHASGSLARSEDALASLSSDKVCCSSPLWSGACPKFQRQTFHEWAACSLPHCGWAKAYYDELRGRGKKHHTAFQMDAHPLSLLERPSAVQRRGLSGQPGQTSPPVEAPGEVCANAVSRFSVSVKKMQDTS